MKRLLRQFIRNTRLPDVRIAWCRRTGRRMATGVQGLETLLTPLAERPLLGVASGAISGILLATSLPLSPLLIVALLVATGAVWQHWPASALRRCARLLMSGLLLTHLQLCWQAQALPEDHIARYLVAPSTPRITVEGQLYRAVENRGERQRLYLTLQRLRQQQNWQPVRGRIRLNVHHTALPFLPGDVVHVERLRLYPARGFLNPGGFNLQRFMQHRGIYGLGGVSQPARIRLHHRPDHLIPARFFEQWRRRLQATIKTHLAPPYEGVFLGLILGDQGALRADLRQQFRATGAAHLLVVSGLHVGFMATATLLGWRGVLRMVRGWLPRAWVPGWRPTPVAVLLSLPAVLVYSSVVGWSLATTRATLMVVSSLLALALSRSRDVPYALVLAATVMLVIQPTALLAVGFQLSFVAVLAIVLVSRRLRAPGEITDVCRRWWRRLRAYVWISSAAYLGTLPIIVGAFHSLPTFGIIANVLLVPLAALLVPAGVGVLGLLILWPTLGALACLPLTLLLGVLVRLMQTIATLPHAQLHLPAPSVSMLVGYYGALAALLLPPGRRWRLLCLGGCAAVLSAGIGWQYMQTRPRHLHVTFLDVGSGDAVVVQAPGNHYLLIDGGGTYNGRFDTGAQIIAPFLWDRYVHKVDLMAMTHPQANHARGLVSLLRLFPTVSLLTNGSPLTAGYLRDLLAAGQRWGTTHHTALDGPRRWHWGRLQLTVLSPPSLAEQRASNWHPPTENDRSLVLRLQYGTVRILLTGDIQRAAEHWLLRHRDDLQADILQIPHHGSKTSTSPAFVRRVRPHVGIISLGARNTYGHPHARVLQTLASQHVRLYRTDVHGAITVRSDGTSYTVTPFRRP